MAKTLLDELNAAILSVDGDTNFERRVAKLTYRFYGLSYPDEPTLQLFRADHPNFPVVVEARRVKVQLDRLVRNFSKSRLLKEYASLYEEYEESKAALVVPCAHMIWAGHELANLPMAAGNPCLQFQGRADDKIFRFEPYLAFLKNLGWSP